MTIARDSSASRLRLPWWVWGMSAAIVAFGLLPFVPAFDPNQGPWLPLFYTAKSCLELSAFVWASRRIELGRRLREALGLNALAFGFSAVLYLLDTVVTLKWVAEPSPAFFNGLTFLTYVVGLAGMLRMPMFSTRVVRWNAFLMDLAASVLGTTAVLIVLVTAPQLRGAEPATVGQFRTFAAAQVVVLVGMNTLILRGIARPSRRAFWTYVTMLLGNVVNLTVIQLGSDSGFMYVAPHFAAAATSLVSIWAAAAFATDPLAPEPLAPGPAWFASFNPLPLFATIAVGVLLLASAFARESSSLTLLAAVMVTQCATLVARLFLTARENARLLQQEAARQQAMEMEKMRAVGRLAGGMAHWYNNLLTTVIGHADIGAMQARSQSAAYEGFTEIRQAANRAAVLTNQLLAYSGRQFVRSRRLPASAFVTRVTEHLQQRWPGQILLEGASGMDAWISGDEEHLLSVFRELVSNAIDAGPRNPVRVNIGRESVEPGAERSFVLAPPPGEYLVVAVHDDGCGIAPEALPSIFDPFYTSKPLHAAAGLGLASVYGVVSAHHGGLAVQSEVGRGSTFEVFLPLETTTAGIATA